MTTESSSLVEKSRDLSITENLEPKCTPNAWPATAFHAIPTTGTPQQEPTFLTQAPTPPTLQQQQQQQVRSNKTTGTPQQEPTFLTQAPTSPTLHQQQQQQPQVCSNNTTGTPQQEPTFLTQAKTPPTLQQQQQPQVRSSKTTQDPITTQDPTPPSLQQSQIGCNIYNNHHHHPPPPGTLVMKNHPLPEQTKNHPLLEQRKNHPLLEQTKNHHLLEQNETGQNLTKRHEQDHPPIHPIQELYMRNKRPIPRLIPVPILNQQKDLPTHATWYGRQRQT